MSDTRANMAARKLNSPCAASGPHDRIDPVRHGPGGLDKVDVATTDPIVVDPIRASSHITLFGRGTPNAGTSQRSASSCYRGSDRRERHQLMTIIQSTPRAKLPINSDPWLSVDQLLENYPFLQSSGPEPRRRIYRLRDLGHFPQHDGRAGRLLLWRQSTIEAWLANGGNRS